MTVSDRDMERGGPSVPVAAVHRTKYVIRCDRRQIVVSAHVQGLFIAVIIRAHTTRPLRNEGALALYRPTRLQFDDAATAV